MTGAGATGAGVACAAAGEPGPVAARPLRLGFLGLGWIGRARLGSVLGALGREGVGEVALFDPSLACCREAGALAPGAVVCASEASLLERDLDGVVIATPNMLHEAQCLAAIERGIAVFCQKPLAPTPEQAGRIVEAARERDVLLEVDWSYRHLRGVEHAAGAIGRGELGTVTAVDLVFHNAWGPEGAWFYDRRLAGGGCLVDLGVHLVDLALLLAGGPLTCESAQVTAGGAPVGWGESAPVEDFAWASLRGPGGVAVRLACSWRAHLGRHCQIGCEVHGTAGGLSIRNVGDSFFDFTTHRHESVGTRPVCADDASWGGGAVAEWARRVARGEGYDDGARRAVEVGGVIEAIYRRAAACAC